MFEINNEDRIEYVAASTEIMKSELLNLFHGVALGIDS